MALARGVAYPLDVPFPATGLTVTATVRKDGGAFVASTNAVTESGTTAVYLLTLTAAEMTADKVSIRLVPSAGTPLLATLITDPTAVALTPGERTAVANEVEAQIIDDTDTEKVLTAITAKIAAANPSLAGLTIGAIAQQVRTELAIELGRIDAAVTSRAASAAVPNTTAIQAAAAAALNAYDPPTRAEATADKSAVIAAMPAGGGTGGGLTTAQDAKLTAIAADASRIPAVPASKADVDGMAAQGAAEVAEQVRIELAPELANLDVPVSSRFAMTGSGGVVPRLTPTLMDELVHAGIDTPLIIDADTAGRTAKFTLTPRGSNMPVLEVDGVASGIVTTVVLTDGATATLSGTYNAELISTLEDDTRLDASGLVKVM